MAAPTLNPEEYQYDDTGVLLNGTSSLPFVDLTSIEGLDSTDVRQSQHDREGVDGGYVEAFYESIRTVTLSGTIYANPNALDTYLDTLKANFAPSATNKPLYFQPDGTLAQRLVFGKSLGLKYTKDEGRRTGKVAMQVQIVCEDSRIYDSAALQASRTGSTGTVTITMGGNRKTPATISLLGPIASPSIAHNISGTTFAFPGYTLAAGQTIVINLDNRSVMRGTTNMRSSMTITGGNWYELSVGANIFTLAGTGTSAATKLTIDARSAWR